MTSVSNLALYFSDLSTEISGAHLIASGRVPMKNTMRGLFTLKFVLDDDE
jgi:hypothetical protein